MVTPFLLRFARPCLSPGRITPNLDYFFDDETGMVRWLGSQEHPFAIEINGPPGPVTKKADIEKGEDTKDRRMWR
jgi:hypothetical protein